MADADIKTLQQQNDAFMGVVTEFIPCWKECNSTPWEQVRHELDLLARIREAMVHSRTESHAFILIKEILRE